MILFSQKLSLLSILRSDSRFSSKPVLGRIFRRSMASQRTSLRITDRGARIRIPHYQYSWVFRVRGEWQSFELRLDGVAAPGMLAVETFCACVMLLGRQQSNHLAILLDFLLFCLLLERGVCRPLLRGMLIFQKQVFFTSLKRTNGRTNLSGDLKKTIGSKRLALADFVDNTTTYYILQRKHIDFVD